MGTILTAFQAAGGFVELFPHQVCWSGNSSERDGDGGIEQIARQRVPFDTAGGDTFPAKRSREQFERFFIPTFTALLFLLQAAGAYFPWKWLAAQPPIIQDNAKLAMSLLALMGLILFLLGRYSSGLQRACKG